MRPSYGGTDGLVTLAVDPEHVTTILSAGADGSLRLALPADDVEFEEDGVTPVAPASVPPVTGDEA